MEAALELKNLAVGYHGKALIRDISLQICRGEVITLIGPNGAGKSTILKTLTRQLQAVGGAVYLGAESLSELPQRELARQVAVVLTERVSPELMTCWDVVASGRYPYTGRMGILTAEDEHITAQAMETVHVLDLAERSYSAISDGQRQRILLARALCQRPQILVLDEPTSYLDIRHKLELLALLRRMAREEELTVLLSLHEIDLAQKASDRVVCVKGDRIAHYGTTEEIFQGARIRELYDLEQGGYDPKFGSVELPRVEGDPEVFVLSGCGTGIPVFRRLQREGIPFAAGILYENDLDYPVARALAMEVVAERPFAEIAPQTMQRAMELLGRCKRVLCTEFPVGPGNASLRPLLKAARLRAEPI